MSDVIDDNAWRPPRSSSPPPEEIEGYADLVEIGRGGDSVVYKARDLAVERDVAIKVLSVDDPVRAERFVREIEITVELGRQHPNIVTVLAIGTTASGRPAIVMDYFERGSLHDQLRDPRPAGRRRGRRRGRGGGRRPRLRARARRAAPRRQAPERPGPPDLVGAGRLRDRPAHRHRAHRVGGDVHLPARLAAAARRAAADGLRRHLVAGLDAVHAARRPAAVLQRRSRRRLRAGLPAPGPHREDPRAGPPRRAGRHRPR